MSRFLSCLCGSQLSFSTCCHPVIENKLFAKTPEILMRSRFSAYCLGRWQYLLDTWHPDTRQFINPEHLRQSTMFSTWLGLEVKNTLINNETGVVEFEAWYLDGKDTGCLHEISDFRKIMGKWFYLKGEVNDRKPTKDEQLKWSIKPVLNSTKENTVLGRNDVCFCGSGKNLKNAV